jgi:formylglycine-generating enzyme required for sulfatase activity
MRRTAVAVAVLAAFGAPARAQSTAEFRDCLTCPIMVPIPPGEFIMGSDRTEQMRADEIRPEGPIRRVTIARPFAAGKYEVTNAEFAAFVGTTDYVATQTCQVMGSPAYVAGKSWRDPGYERPPRDDEPVVCVTWRDAKAYAGWLARATGKPYRLLTEAEWEYVGHGGTQATYPWGEDEARACEHGNVYDAQGRNDPRLARDGAGLSRQMAPCDDGYQQVAPVGRFKANIYGLHDTVGNVFEWVEDCSLALYPPAPLDGSAVQVEGACDKRAIRGGSWRTRLSRQRPTFRGRDPELTSSAIFGFRVARDLP